VAEDIGGYLRTESSVAIVARPLRRDTSGTCAIALSVSLRPVWTTDLRLGLPSQHLLLPVAQSSL
jgi:hypothetical protein